MYLGATDDVQATKDRRANALQRTMNSVQHWYHETMGAAYGGKTFRADPVRVLQSSWSRAQWDDWGTNGFRNPKTGEYQHCCGAGSTSKNCCAMFYATLYDLNDNGVAARHGLPNVGTAGIAYYAVGGGGDNGSAAAGDGWRLGASEAKVLDDADTKCYGGLYDQCSTTRDCAPAGVIAHETGHIFNLPHTSCAEGPSVMNDWWEFDRKAWLCNSDRSTLYNHPFFSTP